MSPEVAVLLTGGLMILVGLLIAGAAALFERAHREAATDFLALLAACCVGVGVIMPLVVFVGGVS